MVFSGRVLHKSLLIDGAWTLLTNVGSKLQTASALVMSAAVAGAPGISRYSVAAGIVAVSAAIADFGFVADASRRLAAGDSQELPTMLRQVFARAMLAGVIGTFLSMEVGRYNAMPLTVVQNTIVGFWAVGLTGTFGLTALGYGLLNFRQIATVSGAVRVAAAFFTIAAGRFAGLSGILVLSLITEMTLACLLLMIMRPAVVFSDDAARLHQRTSASYRWLGVAMLSNMLINKSDIILVSLVSEPRTIAIYVIASQIQNAVSTISIAPSSSTAAYVSTHQNMGKNQLRHMVKATVRTVSRICMLLGILLLVSICAVSLMSLRFSFISIPGTDTIVPLAICLMAAPMSVSAGVYLSAAIGLGEHRDVAKSWLLTAVVATVGFMVLPHLWQAVGAAVAAFLRDATLLHSSRRRWAPSTSRGFVNVKDPSTDSIESSRP